MKLFKSCLKSNCFLIIYLLLITPVFASGPPILTEPSNGSSLSDTSPKLAWEYNGSCSTSDKCFRVLVDNTTDFSSPEKDYYTNNTNYSPSLGIGSWNFKVKAKDENNSWSEFSSVTSFVISESSFTGGQEETTSPQATPSPSTNSPAAGSFSISQIPNAINSSDSFTVQVQTAGLQPSSVYYLKGAFIKSGSTNYFGKTLVGRDWVKNSESYSKQFSFTSDSSGSFTGGIKVSVDPDDSGFIGSGTYILKIGRYNVSGSGPTWSNESNIDITDNSPKESSKATKTSSSPKPAVLGEKTTSFINTQKPVPPKASSKKTSLHSPAKLPQIAGISTSSAKSNPETTQTKVAGIIKFNWWFIGGGVLSLIGSASSLVVMAKKR
jgi:hypothetical protein